MNTESDDNVQVYLRFCPINDLEDNSENCTEIDDDNTRVRLNLDNSSDPDISECDFTFDEIFGCDTGQHEIYDKIGSPLVKEFLFGNDCCLFTYGEAGTGKTYTLLGSGGYRAKFNDDISSLSSCGVSEAPLRPRHIQVTNRLPPRLLNIPEELKPTPIPGLKRTMNATIDQKNLSPIERMMNANANHIKGESRKLQLKPTITQKKGRKATRSSKDNIFFDGIEDAMAKTSETSSGILPYIMKSIFENIFNEIMVKFSMYDIHQEQIRDLLGPKESNASFTIKESNSGVVVEGVTQVGCTTESQVMGLIERGIENRNNTSGKFNYGQQNYIRSHIIFEITSEYYDEKRGLEISNTFRIVDLAGFDNGLLDTMGGIERKLSNRSLDMLKNAVIELGSGDSNFNFYDSKLTQILHDRVGGNCKTALILTASPSVLHASETMKTFDFGKYMRKIVKKTDIDEVQSIEVYKSKLAVSEKTRRELMEIITELQSRGVKLPKRKSSLGMNSIIEEDDESVASFGSEQLTKDERNNFDDLSAAREELKNVSVLLQSASEKMDMDLNAAKKLAISNSGTLQSDSGTVLTSEEIDANIEAAMRDLNVKSSASGTSTTELNEVRKDPADEEKTVLIEALKDEVNFLKREKEDLCAVVSKQEHDLMVAQKDIINLKLRNKDLEKSLQEKLQIKGQQRRTSNDGISLTHTVQSNKLSLVSKKYMEEFESNSISTIDNSDAIRVCLRIRPMNKLETSRRSRDCIKVHENCQKYTVDSPLDGKYEFTYDKVFPSTATQSNVYEYAGVPIVSNLLSGINCCLIGYGIRYSGKTTTLFGSSLSAPDQNTQSGNTSFSTIDGDNDGDDFGILPRVIKGIFKGISKKNDTQEFTVRCSFVAIYLEKLYDLLDPNIKKSLFVGEDDNGITINGACKPVCFRESEIYALILRGRACYSALANHSKLQFGSSCLVFMIEIMQRNTESGSTKIAQLQVADIYGLDAIRTSQVIVNETKLIQHTLTSLTQVVQCLNKGSSCIPYKESKLTSVLKDAFGGNCKTTFIVTASPSSVSISKTVKTLLFGKEIRKITNNPRVNYEHSTNLYKKWLISCEMRLGELSDFVTEFAREISSNESFSNLLSTELWKSIVAIVKEESVEWNPCRKALAEGTTGEIEKLGMKWKALSMYLSKRYVLNEPTEPENSDKIRSLLSDIQSEVHVLRTQNKLLREENYSNKNELQNVKNDLKSIKLKISVMDNKLKHDEFKEKLFKLILTRLRKLILRLQNDLTRNRSDEIISLINSIKGIPDMSGLVDVDALLKDFNLISNEQIDDDNGDQDFLSEVRSAYEDPLGKSIRNLRLNRMSLQSLFSGSTNQSLGASINKNSRFEHDVKIQSPLGMFPKKQISAGMILNENTSNDTTEFLGIGKHDWYQQMELQNELRRVTRKCIDLKVKLIEEEAHVQELVNRSGPFYRKSVSQEIIKLRRDNDNLMHSLKAAGLKVNEIQTINEILETQNLESKKHVTFLENDFHDLQSIFRETIAESHDKERQLREQLQQAEKRVATLLEPQSKNLESSKSNKRILPTMNIPLKGLSSSPTPHEKYILSARKHTFLTRGVPVSQPKDVEEGKKLIHRKAYRKTKYSRRSRSIGNAIGGIKKEILYNAYKQFENVKLPVFEGTLKLQESKESQIARSSYFKLSRR